MGLLIACTLNRQELCILGFFWGGFYRIFQGCYDVGKISTGS